MVKSVCAVVRRYCACGDHMEAKIAPAKLADTIHRAWDEVHSGEGHGEVPRDTCLKAARKQARHA